MRETGLLPHINAGTMAFAEVAPAPTDLWQCIRTHHAVHPLRRSLTRLIFLQQTAPSCCCAVQGVAGAKALRQSWHAILLDQVLSGMKRYELALMVLWLN